MKRTTVVVAALAAAVLAGCSGGAKSTPGQTTAPVAEASGASVVLSGVRFFGPSGYEMREYDDSLVFLKHDQKFASPTPNSDPSAGSYENFHLTDGIQVAVYAALTPAAPTMQEFCDAYVQSLQPDPKRDYGNKNPTKYTDVQAGTRTINGLSGCVVHAKVQNIGVGWFKDMYNQFTDPNGYVTMIYEQTSDGAYVATIYGVHSQDDGGNAEEAVAISVGKNLAKATATTQLATSGPSSAGTKNG